MRNQRRTAVRVRVDRERVTIDTEGVRTPNPLSFTVPGCQFDPEQEDGILRAGILNLPGCHILTADDLLAFYGLKWQIRGAGNIWRDRTKIRVVQALFCTASFRKPGSTETRNETTKQQEYVPLAPYATGVEVRIDSQTTTSGTDKTTQLAEETVQVTGYMITLIGFRTPQQEPAVGDLIDVSFSHDQMASGRTFRVTQVPVGTYGINRVVLCTLLDQGGALP